MDAIRAIVATYISLQNEDAIVALKRHRERLLDTTDPTQPAFTLLRTQCAEELEIINVGLSSFRVAADLADPQLVDLEHHDVEQFLTEVAAAVLAAVVGSRGGRSDAELMDVQRSIEAAIEARRSKA